MLLTVLIFSGCQPEGDTPPEEDTPTKTTSKKEASGWYMRTTAEATTEDGKVYTHKSAGVFGALKESSDEKDRHDIKAFGSATLYVVFPQQEWGEDNGDYFSDYRHYDKESAARQVWTFQVKAKSKLSDATLKLALQGPYKVYKKEDFGYNEEEDSDSMIKNELNLVDVDNNQTYPYAKLNTLTLNMEGKRVRTFRWVKGAVYPEDYDALATPSHTKSLQMQSLKTQQRKPETKFGFPPVP